MARRGIDDPHLDHLVALLLAAREADVHAALHHVHAEAEPVRLLAGDAQELARRKLLLAARLALGVEGGAQELDVGDAGNLDRILEAEEHAVRGAFVRLHSSRSSPSSVTVPSVTS
jgi:hypothetical protein